MKRSQLELPGGSCLITNLNHSQAVGWTPYSTCCSPIKDDKQWWNMWFLSPKTGWLRCYTVWLDIITWNQKHLFINGCFIWMIPNHCIKNGWKLPNIQFKLVGNGVPGIVQDTEKFLHGIESDSRQSLVLRFGPRSLENLPQPQNRNMTGWKKQPWMSRCNVSPIRRWWFFPFSWLQLFSWRAV